MNTILVTTATDDNLLELAKITVPIMERSVKNLPVDFVRFHDGVNGPSNAKKLNHDFVCLNPTNNVYRNITDYLKENPQYTKWMHFDGDVFIGGVNPENYLRAIIERNKSGARMQGGQAVNLDANGDPQYVHYEVISSQYMFMDTVEAIAKSKKFIYEQNVPWTYECALSVDFSHFMYHDLPLQFIPIHPHFPHDKSNGVERVRRLKLFLKKYYAFESFKYRDGALYPWAKQWYDKMFQFRSNIVGNLLCPLDKVFLSDADRPKYIMNWFDVVTRYPNESIEVQYSNFLGK